ncbi:MAG TPA: DUF6152 family protein [Bryobacteraceae bacterium]|jgi:hypothetical protein
MAVAIGGVLLLGATAPAWAHHSFASEYDADKPTKLQGTVKKVEWINPHSWITIEVKASDGTLQTWEIEAGAPNAMFRRGFNKDSLPIGTEIVVTGYLAKNGLHRVNGRDLTLPDGRKLFMATSNPFEPEGEKSEPEKKEK